MRAPDSRVAAMAAADAATRVRLPVDLLGIGTGQGDHTVTQEAVKALALARAGDLGSLESVFDGSGVGSRRLVMPLAWYLEPRSWGERMTAYREVGGALLESAARAAIDEAGVDVHEIDAVLFVSSTGIQAPSIDAAVIAALGLRQDVERTPLAGMGCGGGAIALARGGDLARLWPGRTVLVLGLELSSIHRDPASSTIVDFIGLALFGDGAFAMVLRSEGASARPGASRRARIGPSEERWIPGTADLAFVRGRGDSLCVSLSSRLPEVVGPHLLEAVADYRAAHDLFGDDFRGYVFHPGSKKILLSLLEDPAVDEASIERSLGVLARHGNPSAAGIIFVLEQTLAEAPAGRYVLTAPGPGIQICTMWVEVA